jgi:hypothetical protein
VTGASWGGFSHDTIRVRSGRILFHQGNGDWICSGSVVTDGSSSAGFSTILTAGHCVYGAEGWATKWVFMPDFDEGPVYNDCANTEFGCWTASRLAANALFVSGGGFGNDTVDVDYGFARVGLGGPLATSMTDLDSLDGAYLLKTSGVTNANQQSAFGYPAAGRYKGYDLIYCTNGTNSLIDDPYGASTWGMACNMTGGSSGGPWITGGTSPSVVTDWSASSVNSYGYSNLKGYMFGPRFTDATTEVLGDVADGSTDGTSALFDIP